ncbi:MAG: hypothetical protein WBB73_06235, partial [Candidatus Aminicenantaceae bacterium]
MLAVEAPRFGKGSGAKEDSSPASTLIIIKSTKKSQKINVIFYYFYLFNQIEQSTECILRYYT